MISSKRFDGRGVVVVVGSLLLTKTMVKGHPFGREGSDKFLNVRCGCGQPSRMPIVPKLSLRVSVVNTLGSNYKDLLKKNP